MAVTDCWCCGLPMAVLGDGIGSCDCHRCGLCLVHHCRDVEDCPAEDDDGDDWWDEDGYDDVPSRPTLTLHVQGGVL